VNKSKSASRPAESLQEQLQPLLNKKKYSQALELIQKTKRSQPTVVTTPSEAEIWLWCGQEEFEHAHYRQAEGSFRHALALEHYGDSHYWLVKTLLKLDCLDDALREIQTAFETQQLPKDYSLCYLKLLLLKGEYATVEQLIQTQSKRFSAPQLHWIRGVLALQAGKPEDALLSLQKVKKPLTPHDSPLAWVVYAQQASGNWAAANTKLGGHWQLSAKIREHPILSRLFYWQALNSVSRDRWVYRQTDTAAVDRFNTLEMLHHIENRDYHEAAHCLLKLSPERQQSLESLRPTLLTLAGHQAFTQGEGKCAELFWEPLLKEKPFNPQIAVNLAQVTAMNGDFEGEQRVVNQLIKWIQADAKQHPENWPDDRLNLTLAEAHCKLADTWMALQRSRNAQSAVQQAARLAPHSPEVLGRQGLAAALDERPDQAIALLTQALEGGCRFGEAYQMLLTCHREAGNIQAVNQTRQRFGKQFGDLNAETEVEPWLAVLSMENYPAFAKLMHEHDENEAPPLLACHIFTELVQGVPTASSGRIALRQEAAVKAWDALLKRVPPEEQIQVNQAIAICLQRYAKREKGLVALVNRYIAQVAALSQDYPAAQATHLVLLAVKKTTSDRLEKPLKIHLDTMPQPGIALAELQLQARRFALTQSLRPAIQAALAREPQNPLLLLAMATTYSASSQPYEQYRQQGFELARRLQDSKALQAFRDEEALLELRQVQDLLPDVADLEDMSERDVDRLLESMIRSMLGNKVPKAELERMIPQLKREFKSQMPPGGFGAFDDI
jgi:tetratricopeptide (TPR) repeat protein